MQVPAESREDVQNVSKLLMNRPNCTRAEPDTEIGPGLVHPELTRSASRKVEVGGTAKRAETCTDWATSVQHPEASPQTVHICCSRTS